MKRFIHHTSRPVISLAAGAGNRFGSSDRPGTGLSARPLTYRHLIPWIVKMGFLHGPN